MYLLAVGLTSHTTGALVEHHSPPSPPKDSPPVSLETCTPHDSDPSCSYSVDDILQIILNSRKSWKTLKGQSEAVWPPYLEATMLKGLQEYEPDDSRETRMLGRYPRRNRFISDYIHSATGKYRSAKQVGSRLQQLRDTAEGRKLIEVLTRCYRTRMDTGTCNARIPVRQAAPLDSSSPPFSTISWGSPSSSPVTQTNPDMSRIPPPQSRQPTEPRIPVYIDILPQQSPWSPSSDSPMNQGPFPYAPALSTSNSDRRASDARPICNIDPTVTFVSPSLVNGKSSYIVLLDGAPVHSEDTALEYAGPYLSAQTPDDKPVLYNTLLVPRYWDVLCAAPDPTLYTIIQDVYHMPNPAPSQDYLQRPRPVRIFSATYHFRYISSADSALSCGQPAAEISSGGSSMTSAFHDQRVQGSLSLNPAQATSYPMAHMYAPPTSGGLRTPTGVDQNLFDEPFMLDINFDQIAFDELFANMDNTSDGAFSPHFYAKDPSGFM